MYSLVVKFSNNREHLERTQKGFIYCNSIKYFSKLEDAKVRGDNNEAVIEIKKNEKGIFEFKPVNEPTSEWKKLNFVKGKFKKQYSNPLGNLFCLSSISITPQVEPTIFRFNEKLKQFGDYALLIHHQPLFLKRLKRALKKLKIKGCGRKVEYLDLDDYSGEKTLFQKGLEYSWQEEFRIYIDRPESDPFEFSIGSIEDISTIYDLKKQKEFWIKIPT